jgi:hypothetical protein
LFNEAGIARVYDNWDSLPFEIRTNVALAYCFLIHGDREFYARSLEFQKMAELLNTWIVEGIIHTQAVDTILGLPKDIKLNEAYLRGLRFFPGFK